jgi:hypothetical protein
MSQKIIEFRTPLSPKPPRKKSINWLSRKILRIFPSLVLHLSLLSVLCHFCVVRLVQVVPVDARIGVGLVRKGDTNVALDDQVVLVVVEKKATVSLLELEVAKETELKERSEKTNSDRNVCTKTRTE